MGRRDAPPSAPPCYPMVVVDDRPFPPDTTGPLFTWDIDRTYLATRFSSLRHLARIPFELAEDKRPIAGMPQVLRGLRRGPGPALEARPLCFVTASPPQLRPPLCRRMLLDGVDWDTLLFKDWAGVLREGRPWRLREQAGFKLCALLTARALHPRVTEVLVGDDVEQDALAFSLYARMLHGDLRGGAASRALEEAGLREPDRACALRLLADLPDDVGRVERAFIHLDRRTPRERFAPLAPLVEPVEDAAALARGLRTLGHVDLRTVEEAEAALTRARRPRRSVRWRFGPRDPA